MDRTAALEAHLAYLAAAVETSEDAVLSLDLDGCVSSWNRGAQRLFGFSQSLVRGARMTDLVATRDHPVWERALGLVRAGNPVERLELSVRRRGGSVVPTRVTAVPVRAGDGGLLGVSVVVRDVAEQHLAQATLADNAQRVAQSEALAHVGSWAWDATSDTVQWSEEQHRIHGLSPREFDGTFAGQLDRVHPADRARVGRAMKEALRTGVTFQQEFRVVRPDLAVRWVDARATLVVGQGGEGLGLRGIYHDITERHDSAQVLQEANERLTQLALYDRLTGLPNRVLLVDRLGRSLTRGRELGARVDLIYLGVDDFKTINDSAGHSAGDQVLAALAPVLQQAVKENAPAHRAPGKALARLGGDEFAIVLDDGDPRRMATCIHELLEQPLRLPDDQVFITVSIGNAHVAPSRADATAEVVLTEANIAMHEAKREGKARFVSFEPRMHEAARVRHRLGHELHRALAEDQFVVHYQPAVELATGDVVGAEALVRWAHPTRGLVGPDNFISRAEETGLIVPLGAWVLQQACVEAVSWQQQTGHALTVAVNVSGRQLREPDFVDTVRSALRDSGLPAELLCLEMTESILMERDDVGLGMLTTLRNEGVHLAIDDFGTGYSSLAALQRLPVDQLKIDQSFVAGLPEDDNAATIAWAIVHLGHALELQVLAEGVQTAAQREELLRFGCDHAQGFLFGPGLPSADIVEMASRRSGPVLPRPRSAESDSRRPIF
ncbi:MAG: EAL domain-containing protein [Mycobacteriales bacterium]